MARIARVVVTDLPHHVTQRGNRRKPVLFKADDHRLYRRLVAVATRRASTAVWAYYLMANHVHLIATPADADGCGRRLPKRTGATNASVPVYGISVPGSLCGEIPECAPCPWLLA
jgi:REP element-mobilizing transposase RayT